MGIKKGDDNFIEDSEEVKFTIDQYEDIFSDFDPRPFSEKGLSEDFLFEIERAVMSKYADNLKFTIMVPDKNRSPKDENVIKERLKRHFKKHLRLLMEQRKRILNKGIAFVVVGAILMIIATYLFFKFENKSFITSFFTILLEPASWFLLWEGMDLVIFESKKADPTLQFYERMSNINVNFASSK